MNVERHAGHGWSGQAGPYGPRKGARRGGTPAKYLDFIPIVPHLFLATPRHGRRVRTGRPCGEGAAPAAGMTGCHRPGTLSCGAFPARAFLMRAQGPRSVARPARTTTGALTQGQDPPERGGLASGPKGRRLQPTAREPHTRRGVSPRLERPPGRSAPEPSAARRKIAARGTSGDRHLLSTEQGGPAFRAFPVSSCVGLSSLGLGRPRGEQVPADGFSRANPQASNTSAGLPPSKRGGWTGEARPGGVAPG